MPRPARPSRGAGEVAGASAAAGLVAVGAGFGAPSSTVARTVEAPPGESFLTRVLKGPWTVVAAYSIT